MAPTICLRSLPGFVYPALRPESLRRSSCLTNSSQHVLVLSGAAGWAKTASTSQILRELKVDYHLLGAYATPLALYNALAADAVDNENRVSSGLYILDDTVGVLDNAQALSILNAASWPSAEHGTRRRVIWTSSTVKAVLPHFDFEGKLLFLTNYMTELPQARAFVNRALNYKIEIRAEDVRSLFLEAAQSRKYFPNRELAVRVAQFVAEQAKAFEPGKISLRDLTRAYEFASHFSDPKVWQALFIKTLPQRKFAAAEDVLLLGDEHQEPRNAAFADELIVTLEREAPGRLRS